MATGGAPDAMAVAFAAAFALALALSFSASSAAGSPPAPLYTNYTVGGSAGWFFNSSSNSVVNYTQWASAQNFFLGDYLIFDTDSSNTVVKTLNATTYARCDYTDDDGNETSFYYDGNGGPPAKVTVPVALTDEGANYFFSAADGGAQCLQGMRFEITVAHGQGLPPSLNQPPPPPHVDVVPPPPDIMVTPTPIARAAPGDRAPLLEAALLALLGFAFS